MATATAAVKLTLQDRGFVRTFDRAAEDVKRGSKAMGTALRDSLSSAARGGMDAVKALGSQIKGLATTAGGIVCAVGFGGLVKSAIDADAKFRKLGFTMTRASTVRYAS